MPRPRPDWAADGGYKTVHLRPATYRALQRVQGPGESLDRTVRIILGHYTLARRPRQRWHDPWS